MTAEVERPCPEALPRLVACLDEIVVLCDELCSVLVRERDALTAGKDDRLAVALQEKRDRLGRLGQAEEKRRKVCMALAEGLGLGEVDVPLVEVVRRVGETASRPLLDIKDRLFRAMKEVGALNQGNARLIKRAQHYNKHLIGLLSGDDSDVYGPDGGRSMGTGGFVQRRA